jgi:hypothetical protein
MKSDAKMVLPTRENSGITTYETTGDSLPVTDNHEVHFGASVIVSIFVVAILFLALKRV